MHLKEPNKRKRRKLKRRTHTTRRAPTKLFFVFPDPPMDTRLGSELSPSTLSPPQSKTPTESSLLGGYSSIEHAASHQDDGSSTERASSPHDGDKPRSTTPTESLLSGGYSSTEHAASCQSDGSSTERAASPQDGDKTPTQMSFESQLPQLPSGIMDLDENIHPDSHPVDDDYRKTFLEGMRNVSKFASRPFPLVSAIAPIRFKCSEHPGQGQGLSQASTPQCTPETHSFAEGRSEFVPNAERIRRTTPFVHSDCLCSISRSCCPKWPSWASIKSASQAACNRRYQHLFWLDSSKTHCASTGVL